jgi:putative peptide zinc metalloprotease protein
VVIAGRLKTISVREGQFVRKGALLAEFESQQLEEQVIKARTSLSHASKLVGVYQELWTKETDLEAKEKLQKKKQEAEIDRNKAKYTLDQLEETRKKLILTAPRDGVVMGLPRIDEIGKGWDPKDMEAPFCSIGDPHKLRVLVPVPPADYDVVRDDLKKKRARNEKLEVTIRVRGLDTRTWSGRVSYLPQSADKLIPFQLSTRGGGSLAVKPTSPQPPNPQEPQAQVYLVGIDFEHPDRAIAPGTMAQVKIHVEYRSLAWYAWRQLSSAFDLGLW